ncbi:methyl-accepting chemotaxis protein [Rhizobium sp. G21]|uniref:methyl-accepting chemotaxis protein n=1 Tax=Rhizobium sp. G21 TaxID=2758439 RepID=UPI001603963C|nr:PAS domain-containing methyl-accepting chemotaxis protein [Rhizobium sp. G21]MBB1248466.1 PAS domain-containing methyl-accepting chemotaxis protein [Rhizobium sp. G21]
MLSSLFSKRSAVARYEAISRSHALIWFTPQGVILGANDNFCKALGYEQAEIVGQHHRLFVEPAIREAAEYGAFWRDLAEGAHKRGQFRRIAKDGHDVWIEASYDPITQNGKVVGVVKIAADITATKIVSLHNENLLRALERSVAVVEFDPDGVVVEANSAFCQTMGYEKGEIVGQRHRMFCDPAYAVSQDYIDFWKKLRAGEFFSDTYRRVGKNGKEVWIQATYNPVFSSRGAIYRIVKFATDVTERMTAVRTLSAAIGDLADGNLISQVTIEVDRSMESTRHDFNTAVAKLDRVIGEIAGASRDIAVTSREMLDSAGSIAKRTEQQAASLEETSAALEQITQTVNDSSRRATEAGELVRQTRQSAEESGQVVSAAVAAMGQIENSSKEISNIISVIDEIAFQTNLLALNAGVEAARAGEAGKGFAVVAQEVRELAQRSAKAAKEIKDLITTSSNQVKSGVDLVDRTGRALETIVARVQDIDRNVTAIVEASREQTIGIKEINQAVTALDQGTQQNAASVEEQNAASHQLAERADALAALIGQFRTSGAAPASAAPSRAKAAPSPVSARPAPQRAARAAAPPAAPLKKVANGGDWEEF